MPRNTQDQSPSPQRRHGSEDPNLEGVDRLYKGLAQRAMLRLARAEYGYQPLSREDALHVGSTVSGVMDRLQLSKPGALRDARNLIHLLNGTAPGNIDPRVVASHAPSPDSPQAHVDHRDPGLYDRPTHIMPPTYVSDQRHHPAA